MAQILDLPNELLFDIISYLRTDTRSDVTTLSRLCQTSHHFLYLAQPTLYKSVVVAETKCVSSLIALRRTLMQKPSLAGKVTTLTLFYTDGAFEWANSSRNTSEPKSRGYCTVVLIVLNLLPNLQHLRLNTTMGLPQSLFTQLWNMQYREANPALLSKLKTFHLYNTHGKRSVSLYLYREFMRYPSFEKLSIETDIPGISGQRSTTTTVTRTAAELLGSEIPVTELAALGIFSRSLTRFKYATPYIYPFEYDAFNKNAARLILSCAHFRLSTVTNEIVPFLLKLYKQSLQTLHLDFHYNLPNLHNLGYQGNTVRSLGRRPVPYMSFRGFKHLSHLTIEFERLEKVCHLPESLESLELRYCYFEDIDRAFLVDLVRLRETWCPAIKSVTINGWEDDKSMAAIRKHAESLDVRVSASLDGPVLEILGFGYHLVIQTLDENEYVG